MSNSAVLADQRWGFDSAGNRALEHDMLTGVRTEFSHTNTNALVDRKVYSSNQKPWVQGSLDEPGSVSLGGQPVAVKGDNTFQGQAPSRTTTISAKDSAGNAANENWQLNAGSGSTPDSTLAYSHDAEGNLLGDGTSTFEWDLRNRLTAIVTGTHRTEFTYDGADRRVRVVEKDNGSVTSDKRRVYHGLSLLEERAADNSTVLRRFYGGGQVDVADGGKRYAYTTDHLGSVREVLLLDGTSGNPTTATLTARYDYDLWGKRTVLDGGTPAETLTLSGYTGHEYHQPSGLWLAPYRAYSPALGRWLSRDPIGEAGGINLFAYVGNGPGVATDPLGLWIFVSGSDLQKKKTYMILDQIKANDPQSKAMIESLENSPKMHIIEPNNNGDTHAADIDPKGSRNGIGSSSIVRYDEVDAFLTGETIVLAHELQHAYDMDKGIIDDREGSSDPKWKNKAEERAVAAENRIREKRGLELRKDYIGNPPLPGANSPLEYGNPSGGRDSPASSGSGATDCRR